eukprot:c5122_g1_i1.p1 GENE.c5122_g1_i1~~c5122_g1_i1.p1  ORF type:complete len:132 (-),score=20.57 c5122_g1_i1:40-435(-)
MLLLLSFAITNLAGLDGCSDPQSTTCIESVYDYCEKHSWDPSECQNVRVACPFDAKAIYGIPSPCTLDECIGVNPNRELCLKAVTSYCSSANGTTSTACEYFVPGSSSTASMVSVSVAGVIVALFVAIGFA